MRKGSGLEAHGGYLCRFVEMQTRRLVELAREAIALDGQDSQDCSLLLSLKGRSRILRLAFDAPHTYGRRGARWYEANHSLARLLSREYGVTVHAYVFDPDELEQVIGYGEGRKVGGDRIYYDEADLPGDVGEVDDFSFERLQARWPLGHLATVLGIEREELLKMARQTSVLLDLSREAPPGLLSSLFPVEPQRPRLSRFASFL